MTARCFLIMILSLANLITLNIDKGPAFDFESKAGPFLVRVAGVEPARLSVQEPKSCASANSAIPAYSIFETDAESAAKLLWYKSI